MSVPSPPRMRRRRLQRDADFTGARLTKFREVFLRHGLPGLALACIFLASPGLRDLFVESLSRASNSPLLYVFGALIILVGLSAYVRSIDRDLSAPKFGWILYLGALSLWEEWVFRLAIPQVMEGVGISVWLAILLSALLFAAMHYFYAALEMVLVRRRLFWCFVFQFFDGTPRRSFTRRSYSLGGDDDQYAEATKAECRH